MVTPTPGQGYIFDSWTGSTCTGYTSGGVLGASITFDRPTTNRSCTATFEPGVSTRSWTTSSVEVANGYGQQAGEDLCQVATVRLAPPGQGQ